MTFLPPGGDESPALLKVTASPAPVPDELKPRQRKSFLRMVGALLGLCRDYSIEDLARLKEAGVQIVEAKAGKRNAEKEKTLAEAELLYAQAEAARLDAATRQFQAEVEATVKLAALGIPREEAIASATAHVVDVVSRIRQKAGMPALNSAQLEAILKALPAPVPLDAQQPGTTQGGTGAQV